MNNNLINIIIATGGTGGHIIPACCLAKHLSDKKIQTEMISDNRGLKYLKDFKGLKIQIIDSSSVFNKNIIKSFWAILILISALIKSLIYLFKKKPNLVIGMGGYASFPVCVASKILKIPLMIYENNLHIGKANKYLLPIVNKILVSNTEIEGIDKKYNKKIHFVGNIIRKEILDLNDIVFDPKKESKLKILVLGGSQAAKVFGNKLPKIFKQCHDYKIPIEIFQQCLPEQNDELNKYYRESNIDFNIFNFEKDLSKYYRKINFAITRSGSSVLAELFNARIPFISVPLPSSADNHQYKNAIYYKKNGYSYLIEEKFLNKELFGLIKNINANKSILNKISAKQGQHSDKSVYENIDKVIKSLNNEKY